jgi:D-alanyl-D-alanine carboxypeptidase/D-alanyl-D-alanine-endopeptidase (penicillin-binding protein 4)
MKMLVERRGMWRQALGLVCAAMLLSSVTGVAHTKPAARRPRTLGQRLEVILRRSEGRHGFWGIEVVQLPRARRLYARNADHLFVPASNTKLFTGAAALEKLGLDFVFRTTVESPVGPDAAGRVPELALVGRGDPNLGSRLLPYQVKSEPQCPADRVFRELADQVKARGVREVSGDLIADDSYFLYEPYNRTWTLGDTVWGYGAPVTALAFNDNVLLLHVRPASRVGDPVLVSVEPLSDYYRVTNRLVTSAAGTERQLLGERVPGSRDLAIWGQIPIDSPEDGESLAIENPPQLAGELFRKALEARGIVVRGSVVARHFTPVEAAASPKGSAPAPTRLVLAEHVSLPLREAVKVLTKVSQNLHAEMLLRTLGREVKNSGSLAAGLEVLQEFTTQVGITPEEFRFADGSGLSREGLVGPHAVIKLLTYMVRSPHFEAFYDSLPIAGVDGTLAERFRGTRAAGRIHAKTGTLEHTNALSGYMDLPSGKRLAFSIVGNNHLLKPADGAKLLDQLVLAIYEWYGRRPRPRKATR